MKKTPKKGYLTKQLVSGRINSYLLAALEESQQYLGKLAADNEGIFLGLASSRQLRRNEIIIKAAKGAILCKPKEIAVILESVGDLQRYMEPPKKDA